MLPGKKYATREKNPTNEDAMIYYSEIYPYEYVIGADQESSIFLVGIPVNALIIQVEKEIKPMAASEWSWNAVSRILTLTDPSTSYKDQLLSIIYKKYKTTL